MSMQDDRSITKVFIEASDLAPAARRDFLDRVCAGNPRLRAEVDEMLEHDAAARDILETGGPVRRMIGRQETCPDRIGPYRIVDKLGHGGMGVVYLAEQEQPLRRRVAVKLIRLGIDTEEVIARFDSERRALAVMNHTNIACVFDAGATERGRPYFAMEYVEGRPVTTFCDEHGLDVDERLALFVQVCEGVQHAHQRGIIHRDLKPSNILVARQHGRAVPKIIDFGVAKALDSNPSRRTLRTGAGAIVGTPEYMSPEQASVSGDEVDTRTDVYSLGVLLYELVAGCLPFDSRQVGAPTPQEIGRMIRDVEPAPPSTRLSVPQAVSVARARGTDAVSLARRLRGDLDWITMRALEKDPARRYASPADLAADVGRYLRHEPVWAGPPSRVYRFRKFVAKHKIGMGFAATLVALVLGFATTMSVQAGRIVHERHRATREAATAEQVAEFLVDLFRVAPRIGARVDQTTAEETLIRGTDKVRNDLAHRPVLQAELFHTMGDVYRRVGHTERALPLLEEAADSLSRLLGPDHPETLGARRSLARLYLDTRRMDSAESAYRSIYETRRRVLGEDHADTLRSLIDLAYLYKAWDRDAEAETLFIPGVDGLRRALGEDDPETLIASGFLAGVWLDLGRYDRLLPLLNRLTETMPRVLGQDHQEAKAAIYNLACVHARLGDRAAALARLADAVDAGFVFGGRLFEDPHLSSLHGDPEFERLARMSWLNQREAWSGLELRAAALDMAGRFSEAETTLQEILDGMDRAGVGPDDPERMGVTDRLIRVGLLRGRWQAARALSLEVIRAAGQAPGDQAERMAETMWYVAQSYFGEGDREQAVSWLDRAVDIYRGIYLDTSLVGAWADAASGAARGDRAQALAGLRNAIDRGYEDGDQLARDLTFLSLRGDPEFQSLIDRMDRFAP